MAIPMQEGWTSLHLASEQGHTEIVTVLIEAGADLEAENEVIASQPLDLTQFSIFW
jgi:ankyrin repeat protein